MATAKKSRKSQETGAIYLLYLHHIDCKNTLSPPSPVVLLDAIRNTLCRFLFFFISKDGWFLAQRLTLSGPKSVENVEWNNETLSLLLLSYVIPFCCKKGNNNEAHLLITKSKATELILQLSCSALLTAEVWRKGHCHNTQLLFPVWVIEKCCRVLGYHAGVKIKACRPTRPVEVAVRGRHDGEEWWGVKAETRLAPLAEVTQDCQCSRDVTCAVLVKV